MNLQIVKNITSLGIISLLLSGCAGYKSKTLHKLHKGSATKVETIDCVTVYKKELNELETKEYFGENLIRKGIQPIQIQIENNSKEDVKIVSVSPDSVDNETVLKHLYFSPVGRGLSYGVASLFIWPFIFPSVIDAIGAGQANDEMEIDVRSKTLEHTICSPHTAINGLIFARKEEYELNKSIQVVLEKNQKTLTFN